jgi:hypothetical protein
MDSGAPYRGFASAMRRIRARRSAVTGGGPDPAAPPRPPCATPTPMPRDGRLRLTISRGVRHALQTCANHVHRSRSAADSRTRGVCVARQHLD